ncbi:hypothetical protein OOK31_04235 [Streptomyces sp. NBC_00249]|uniref:hypothetical protein n=1 Tax=Streptomyces sp. NBC_00249 TaxID=2975690 RepID=UPI00224F6052|nr:hypothetical protein [Streptomyces sp. NBC_00249]MCX5193106.1 hypothetical protein [Streptomyces sp. NBC_00249]
MPAIRAVSWLSRNVDEFRLAVALVVIGVPVTLTGAVLYALPGSGFPELVVGLSCLVAGLAMLGSNAGRR